MPERISAEALTTFAAAALRRVGFREADAELAAEVVVEADLRGVDSHGVRVLAGRVAEIKAGLIDPRARPLLLKRGGAMAQFDGQHGYGPLLCASVLETATELADANGIGMVLLKNSSHWGCPAYYSRWMAARGCIGIGLTNTHPVMPLWGSSAPSIGNNPLTIAAPRRDREPIVLDMAMQQVAWGGLRLAAEKGEKLAGPWGYDMDGRPTDDPAEILKSNRVRPMGDHKGSGLAFMIEILTGVISAGLIAADIGERMSAKQPVDYSQTFIAIRPDRFMTIDRYHDQVERLCQAAKAAPLASGFAEISLPGDRSNRSVEERRRLGIPIAPLRSAIERIAGDCALPLPWQTDQAAHP
jgi:LDH2 family malate/lactate/ureidoglycolate dehydrogenase